MAARGGLNLMCQLLIARTMDLRRKFEKENCPGIFYGFRACSTYDLDSGHNLLLATSNFLVSLLAYKE